MNSELDINRIDEISSHYNFGILKAMEELIKLEPNKKANVSFLHSARLDHIEIKIVQSKKVITHEDLNQDARIYDTMKVLISELMHFFSDNWPVYIETRVNDDVFVIFTNSYHSEGDIHYKVFKRYSETKQTKS